MTKCVAGIMGTSTLTTKGLGFGFHLYGFLDTSNELQITYRRKPGSALTIDIERSVYNHDAIGLRLTIPPLDTSSNVAYIEKLSGGNYVLLSTPLKVLYTDDTILIRIDTSSGGVSVYSPFRHASDVCTITGGVLNSSKTSDVSSFSEAVYI